MEELDTRLLPSAEGTKHRGWYSGNHYPHFDVPGLIQHITFRLTDSLPRTTIWQMEEELSIFPRERHSIERRKHIQRLLDEGLGSCILKKDKHAQIVEESLFFGDGKRYRLIAWVIMPNHVHILIEQLEGWPLGKVVQSWKRHTTREINRLRSSSSETRRSQATSITRRTQVWERDYWDRYIRDQNHLEAAIRYIEWNPVKAGLVEAPEDWRWGSAHRRAARSLTHEEENHCDSKGRH